MPQRFSIVFVTRSYYSKANSTSDKHAYNRRSCSCDVKKKKKQRKRQQGCRSGNNSKYKSKKAVTNAQFAVLRASKRRVVGVMMFLQVCLGVRVFLLRVTEKKKNDKEGKGYLWVELVPTAEVCTATNSFSHV